MIKRYLQLTFRSDHIYWSVTPKAWEQLVTLCVSIKPSTMTTQLTPEILDLIGHRIKRKPEHADMIQLSTFHHPLHNPSFWNEALQDIKRNKRNRTTP